MSRQSVNVETLLTALLSSSTSGAHRMLARTLAEAWEQGRTAPFAAANPYPISSEPPTRTVDDRQTDMFEEPTDGND